MYSRATWLAVAFLAAAAGPVSVSAQMAAARLAGALAIETAVEAVAAAAPVDGEPRVALTPLATRAPGSEAIYTIAFTNVGERPIQETRISAAIPPGLGYVNGTAFAPGAKVLFSVDGGRRYAPPEELVVRDTLDTERAAQAADYTHVRWVLRFPLEPGARGTARFRAVLLDTL